MNGRPQAGWPFFCYGEVEQRGETTEQKSHDQGLYCGFGFKFAPWHAYPGETLAARRATCCQLLYRAGFHPGIRRKMNPAMLERGYYAEPIDHG